MVISEDLTTVDPFAQEWREHPWPIYRRLQDESPVHPRAPGSWLLTRWEECEAVLRDRRFGSDPRNLNAGGRAAIGAHEVYQDGTDVLLFMDPPDHTRLRSLVSKAFTPKEVARLRPWVGERVRQLLAEHRGQMELLADLAYPLPAEVICELLGVPVTDRDQFHGWSSAAARLLDGDLEPDTQEEAMAGSIALFAYFAELLADRRGSPGSDLISGLLDAQEDGDRLSDDELLTLVVTLFVAGHETTMNLIGNGVLALLDHPDQLAALATDRSLAARVTEEALRYEGPAQLTPRVALQGLRLGDQLIEAGDSVTVCLGAANRDPRRFVDPDRFDAGRADAGHLAFSFGAHHCLGAALARMEAEEVFAAVAALPGLALVGPRPRHRPHAILRGLEELPIRFD